eukprot:scaffold2045_cov404-Prasinococcus_capsulatus_cf.AAC.78
MLLPQPTPICVKVALLFRANKERRRRQVHCLALVLASRTSSYASLLTPSEASSSAGKASGVLVP